MDKDRVVVILGPTATGKSHCGIELARRFRGEIISGDSMLVYRQMNIGTAKPSKEELAAVPHHLVNILPPDASYSVADFQQQAAELIRQITLRGNLPILVGGTGLYIKALLEDYRFSGVEEKPELRRQLEGIEPGRPETVGEKLDPILSNSLIFGSDLTKTPLAERIRQYFDEEIAGSGAVRATLRKYLPEE